MSKDNVSHKINIFNFIFTVLILVYHSRFLVGYKIIFANNFDSMMFSNIFKFIDYFAFLSMTFFFMMSAFLFYKNVDSEKDAFVKIKKRVKTLLIPYFIWFCITYVVRFFIFHEHNITSISSFIDAIFFLPIDGPMWYILALFLLILPSPLIVKLKKSKKIATLFLLFLILIIQFRCYSILENFIDFNHWWWLGNLIGYIPAFSIGAYFGMFYSDLILKNKYNKFLKLISLFIVIFPFLFLNLFSKIVNVPVDIYINSYCCMDFV